jgi:hypothetical protein
MRHAVLLSRKLHSLHLEIIGQDETRHLSFGEGNTVGAVDQMRHLCGRDRGLDVGACNILKNKDCRSRSC